MCCTARSSPAQKPGKSSHPITVDSPKCDLARARSVDLRVQDRSIADWENLLRHFYSQSRLDTTCMAI
jgi:hypothetical protein